MEREIDTVMGAGVGTEKLRENVIWSGCFGLHAPFALPYREGE